MDVRAKKTILRSLTALAVIISFWSAYLAGYNRGGKDALDGDFSALIGGNLVPVGRGDALFRSRLDLRPTRNVNIVFEPFGVSPISYRTIQRTGDSRSSYSQFGCGWRPSPAADGER